MKNNIKQKLITAPLFLMLFHKLNYETGGGRGADGDAGKRNSGMQSNKMYEKKTEAKQISPFFN